MADILVERQTHIMIGGKGGLAPLYPSDTLYPSNMLYPRDATLEELGNIVAGSMQLDEMLVDKEPVWGLFFSTKFEVKLFNIDEDLSGRYIHVYQTDRGVRTSVFTGYIESCKKDKIGDDRTLIAYDPAYYWGSTDVSKWWVDFWEAHPNGATLHDVRMHLLGTFMFPHEDVVLPNDDVVVNMNINLASGSFAAIMKMLCELSCSYPHFTRDGLLEFILFNTEAEPIDLKDRYEWNASDFEEYETSNITGVQFFDSGDQLKRTIGSADNAYGIYQNAFTYSMNTETLDAVGHVMLSYLQDFKFVPSNIKMIVGDFDINVGDYVKTEFGNFYVFKNSYSGSQLIEQTISAQGSMKLNSTAQPIDFKSVVLSEQIARIDQNVEHFYVEYTNTVQGISSRIEQTANELNFKIDSQTTSAYIITRINQNGDDGKIVSSVEIGADVIDINGIVRLLEAEEIRTVLNGETGQGEPAKFIKYTGNNIEFFEGSYDDNALKAALSYDGLDYYRNDSLIGRYTTNAYKQFPVTNLFSAIDGSTTMGGITRSYINSSSYRISGTTDIGENNYVRIPLMSRTLENGKRYRLTYSVVSGNLPSAEALQIIADSIGLPTQPYLICNLNEANKDIYFTFGAFSQTANCTFYFNIYKSGVTFDNVTLDFNLYDLTEEQTLQYGLDIQLREGEFWDVSVYDPINKINDIKLLYAKESLFNNKNHSSIDYTDGYFYALTPWEFRDIVSLKKDLYTNGNGIRYNENSEAKINVNQNDIILAIGENYLFEGGLNNVWVGSYSTSNLYLRGDTLDLTNVDKVRVSGYGDYSVYGYTGSLAGNRMYNIVSDLSRVSVVTNIVDNGDGTITWYTGNSGVGSWTNNDFHVGAFDRQAKNGIVY